MPSSGSTTSRIASSRSSSSVHFTRAGYFATPANAMPSSSTSSSGSIWPRGSEFCTVLQVQGHPCHLSAHCRGHPASKPGDQATSRGLKADELERGDLGLCQPDPVPLVRSEHAAVEHEEDLVSFGVTRCPVDHQ